ncbi:hypothetical protein BV20DRAFT_539764 [Pilatotrama ljubarskyi]|nr:hypothetical protein BV20DRAFT_539764 [Pilatotrama ljubarskyi]
MFRKDGERVRELIVDWSSMSYGRSEMNGTPFTERFLTASLPDLESCVLMGVDTASGPGRELQTLFVDTPRLRILELLHPPLIPSNSYPALTHLSLHCPNLNNMTSKQLLGLLSRSPQLQVLRFGDLPRTVGRPPPSPVGLVHISLRHLAKSTWNTSAVWKCYGDIGTLGVRRSSVTSRRPTHSAGCCSPTSPSPERARFG